MTNIFDYSNKATSRFIKVVDNCFNKPSYILPIKVKVERKQKAKEDYTKRPEIHNSDLLYSPLKFGGFLITPP